MNNICPQLNTNYNELKKLKDEFFSNWDDQGTKDVEKAFKIKQSMSTIAKEIEEKIEKEFFDIPYAESFKKKIMKDNIKSYDKTLSKYKFLKMIKVDKYLDKISYETYNQNNVLISMGILSKGS